MAGRGYGAWMGIELDEPLGTALLSPHTPKAVAYGEHSHYCRFHTPKAVTYGEQSHYCRFMIGHSLVLPYTQGCGLSCTITLL